jgi:hypothetical protein
MHGNAPCVTPGQGIMPLSGKQSPSRPGDHFGELVRELDKAKVESNSHITRLIRRQLGTQIGRDLGVRVMASHLKIDFEALAIDVQLIEGMQLAVLTIVSIDNSLEVSLPLQALEQFRDRISRMLPEVSLRTQTQEPPIDH